MNNIVDAFSKEDRVEVKGSKVAPVQQKNIAKEGEGERENTITMQLWRYRRL